MSKFIRLGDLVLKIDHIISYECVQQKKDMVLLPLWNLTIEREIGGINSSFVKDVMILHNVETRDNIIARLDAIFEPECLGYCRD